MDSLSVVELLTYIEKEFSADILGSDNFDVENVATIEKLVEGVFNAIVA
ncbi:MAG: hypothetical protein HZA00_13595 [Nitrospinae bacterium]|nr:hypothetical protein [Nitrospinota bacterium]